MTFNGHVLKSKVSEEIVQHVVFQNTTKQPVELFWINFNGLAVSYGMVLAGTNSKPIYTYETHPWFCVGITDKERKVFKGGQYPGRWVYFP